MRRSKPVRIGELWAGYVDESPRLTRGLCEARIPEVWPQVAGNRIASLTTSIDMNKGVLTIRLSSSVARHEMFMRREELRLKLNEAVGMSVIRVLLIK